MEFDAAPFSNEVKKKGFEQFDLGRKILQRSQAYDGSRPIFTRLSCSDGTTTLKAFYGRNDMDKKRYDWMYENILEKKEEGGDYFPKLVKGSAPKPESELMKVPTEIP